MKKQVVLHPVLFSLFPSLFLYAMNSGYYELSVVVVPAIVCVALGLAAWGVARMFLADKQMAAMVVSAFLLPFFSFGAVYDNLTRAEIAAQGYGGQGIPPGELVIMVCLAVVLAAVALMIRLKRFMNEWTYLMNVVGTILVFLPLTNIAMAAYVSSSARGLLPETPALPAIEKVALDAADKPDIYHIILDGYGSENVFRDDFEYDNSGLTEFLESKGFSVARNARSNYSETANSLASTMNAAYLHEALGQDLNGFTDHEFLRELMRDNFAEGFLRSNGYQIVAFGTEYENARIGNPDVSLAKWGAAQPFSLAVFEMTPVPWLLRKAGYPLLYELHRERILYTLGELGEVARLPGPKFVYAHILFAHTPFVFGPGGEAVNPDRRFHMWVHGDLQENIDGYRNQVNYLNTQLKTAVESILEHSERPPVILIHGDHGPGMKDYGIEGLDAQERFGILYGLFLPDGKKALTQTSSLVNAYRYIFNHCFGTNYPILKDASYYTPRGLPYDFTLVDSAVTASHETPGEHE
jgi:hypothetical protein